MRHPDDGLIEEYLDGELPAEARSEFEAHAAGCDACRERIETARAGWSEADELVALLGEPEPRPGTGKLPASLRPPAPRPVRWRTLAWAASVLMAAGLGYAGGTTERRSDGATERRTVGPSDSRVAAEAPEPRPASQPSTPPAAAEAPSRRAAEEASVSTGAASAEFGAPLAAPEAGRQMQQAAEPPSNRLEEAAPLAKQRVDGELARPLASREAVRFADADEAAAGRAQPAIQPSSRPATSLDAAVRALGGSIRLVDGLEVKRVEVAWLPMPGGDSAAVVELTYADAAGNPIVLRQSRTVPAVGQLAGADAAPAKAVAPARDRALAAESPSRRAAETTRDGELTWLDASGFRLVLRADADADSLARIRSRVR
jgi:hypothetical protein